MGIRIMIPDFLRSAADNNTEILCEGTTVGEVFDDAVSKYPKLKPYLFGENNRVNPFNPFVHIYINDTHLGLLQGGETEVKPDDEILMVTVIGGG